jgi:DNA invertase Pin-like site-specific DNA recombinase
MMANALVVRKSLLPKSQIGSRAAQYVRMSTDHQQYSIENQAIVIGAYAQARNLTIVRTYRDEGESGLRLRNRAGLRQLLDDVQSDHADFNHILVYDVSRWGRFQDTDESAHYEFICKLAGIKVQYCAEQFENDGTMLSSIVKNLKRVMAAEFSRELSTKVHAGQSRIVRLGFRHGGPLGYGLRRELFDEQHNSKGLLKKGELKCLRTDRVRVREGNPDELAVVRWIFQQCLDKTPDAKIARTLNQQRTPTGWDRPWNGRFVAHILQNENYIGNIVYNRQSHKLGTRKVSNSPDAWVRAQRCFPPIIDPDIFERVQRILRSRRIEIDEAEMLTRLRRALHKKGRLNQTIINDTSGLPHVDTFIKHFGSLRHAYSLIGYTPTERDWSYLDTKQAWADARNSFTREVATTLEKLGHRIVMCPSGDHLYIDGKVGVAFRVARAQAVKGLTLWRIFRPSNKPHRWIAVIRLRDSNQSALDYLTMPTHTLSARHHSQVTFTDRARERLAFDSFRSATALARSIHQRTRIREKPDRAKRRPMRAIT